MDFFEWMKVLAAIALSIIAVLTIRVIGDLAFYQEPSPGMAYKAAETGEPDVDMKEVQRNWPYTKGERRERAKLRNFVRDIESVEVQRPEAEGGERRVAVAVVDFATLMASADAGKGRRSAQLCSACHTFEKGAGNGVGPNLWDIVGRDIAAVAGFNYSAALAGVEGAWTYERLNEFLEDPAGWAPGNKMAFLGVRRAADRANIVAYLRSMSDNPQPLPEPAPAEETAASGEGAETATPEGGINGG